MIVVTFQYPRKIKNIILNPMGRFFEYFDYLQGVSVSLDLSQEPTICQIITIVTNDRL